MRSVLLIRCLLKMPPSSSTSTGLPPVHRLPPGGDLWREQRRDFSCDLLHRRRERCSSDHRQFISESGSARYSSTPPLTTVWSNYQTLFNDFFEVYITKMVTLSPNIQTDFSSVQFCTFTSRRDRSFFALIGQSPHSWRIPLLWP